MNEFPVVVILFIWSAVLLVNSWQLYRAARELDEERAALRRWSRLRKVCDSQQHKWQ
jgi:hypothetical protein